MKDKPLLSYYDRQLYQRQQELARAERNRSASRFLSGDQSPTSAYLDPHKHDYRLSPRYVSEQAEQRILQQRDMAYSALRKITNEAGITFHKGNNSVATPVPELPHFKEVTLCAIATGPDSYLVVSMTNSAAGRVEVMPDGKLHYRDIAKPSDGDKEATTYPVRAVRKLDDGSFALDERFTQDGIAWRPDNLAELGELLTDANQLRNGKPKPVAGRQKKQEYNYTLASLSPSF